MVKHSKGTVENPISHEEIYRKFQILVNHIFPRPRCQLIAEKVSHLEEVSDIHQLSDLLRAEARGK